MGITIIIGFMYDNTLDKLPNIDDDIRIMTKFSIDYFTENRIVVISDIAKTDSYNEFYPIKDFSTKGAFFKLLTELIYNQEQIVFYYSGHGKVGCLMMPGDFYIDTNELTKVFFASKSNAKILSFFDCCHGAVLDLPYTLDRGFLKYTGGDCFPRQNILSINGTTAEEKTELTTGGSTLTTKLVRYWKPGYKVHLLLETLPFTKIMTSIPSLDFSITRYEEKML